MSGHSKWSTIRHKKAAVDAKRGKIFTKLVKEITIAARDGGGDPEMNPRLRLALATAKDNNMPQDNIERAIKKGTGELPGQSFEELMYEGYGQAGVAILVEVVTDNRNRTTPEVRNIFNKKGGSMGESGCVAWMFKKKGVITVPHSAADEDALMELVLEAGAEDLSSESEYFEISTDMSGFEAVKKALDEAKIPTDIAELSMIPDTTVPITEAPVARSLLALVEAIEEHEDVQNVYANFDIDDQILKELE